MLKKLLSHLGFDFHNIEAPSPLLPPPPICEQILKLAHPRLDSGDLYVYVEAYPGKETDLHQLAPLSNAFFRATRPIEDATAFVAGYQATQGGDAEAFAELCQKNPQILRSVIGPSVIG
jgi:hypothetical protein